MFNALKDNGIIYISFKVGKGYQIKNNIYYNFLTEKEVVEILEKVDVKVKVIEYFETLPCTKRKQKNIIWGNLIVKKES